MCNQCFNEEIESFPTQDSFDTFELELTRKLTNDKAIRIGLVVSEGVGDLGYQVCECNYCGQLWKFSPPDHAHRGYFLRLDR